jgi:hypothetical protein
MIHFPLDIRGEMRELRFTLAFTALLSHSTYAADAPIKCSDISALSAPEKAVFARGMANAVGAVFGVLDTFSRQLEALAKTPEEKSAIEKMHTSPIGFLSKICWCDYREIERQIAAACASSPEKYVGNVLTDVLAGIRTSH